MTKKFSAKKLGKKVKSVRTKKIKRSRKKKIKRSRKKKIKNLRKKKVTAKFLDSAFFQICEA